MPAAIRMTGEAASSISTPPTGKIYVFLDTATGKPSYKDDGGTVNLFGSTVRATVTKTTGSLVDSASETGTVTLAKTTVLLAVIADRACRVELYATSAARTADASRAVGVLATPGTGVLAEFVFAAAGTTIVSPVVVLANGDGSPTSAIYYTITNRSGSTSTVQVQFTHLPLEL